MSSQFVRTELMYGKDAIAKLRQSRVAVFGIGGVGGYVVEALVRSGVGAIDLIDNELPRLKSFVLPGGALQSSMAQVARTVCRRCERRIIALAEITYIDTNVLKFINRLSDYLFVLARFINVSLGIEEKYWNKDC